jgi:outer membrane protein assembly factor BamB
MVCRATHMGVVLVALLATGFPALAQVTWPMYQANASHDGYIPVAFDPTAYAALWEAQLSVDGFGVNPVTAADGKVFASLRVYFIDGIDHFFCLDAGDGSILWSKAYGRVFSVNPPAYAGGKVYIQVGNHGSDTHLYEYDATSGAFLDDGPFSAQWERYYAPTVYAGRVYINGGYFGGMYAFDFSKDPTEQWFLALNQYQEWTPAVDGHYAYAYTGERVSIVDVVTGDELWTIPDPNFDWNGWSMNLAPVLGGDGDLLAVQGGRLISFDLSTHTIRYEIPEAFSGQVSVREGVAYVFNDGALEARTQAKGAFLWSWQPPADWQLVGTMILTDAHAIVHASQVSYPYENATYAVDLDSHQSVWSYPVGGHLAWSEGILYIARDDGYLTALSSTLLFADGFESGETTRWSAVAP